MEEKKSPFINRETAVMWQSRSAEKKACYYQAYRLASYALDRALSDCGSDRPRAIILDLDETVLDNSPFFARLLEPDSVIDEEALMKEFVEWLDSDGPETQPGACQFLDYAKSLGVEPFYVSNRPASLLDTTIKALRSGGCPNADPEHVLLKEGPLDSYEPVNFYGQKKALWEKVAADHDVLLYIGDNLDDLGGAFTERGDGSGRDVVDENAAAFGTRFILMPNPMYGPWELHLDK